VIDKNDTVRAHDQWTEETLKHRPKHRSEGLTIEPWQGLAALCVLLFIFLAAIALLMRF
jgi:hypothetical protein